MFVHITSTRGELEVLNVAHIVKLMEMPNGDTRFNMTDKSYIVTHLSIDEAFAEVYNQTEESK